MAPRPLSPREAADRWEALKTYVAGLADAANDDWESALKQMNTTTGEPVAFRKAHGAARLAEGANKAFNAVLVKMRELER